MIGAVLFEPRRRMPRGLMRLALASRTSLLSVLPETLEGQFAIVTPRSPTTSKVSSPRRDTSARWRTARW